jgi:hypothetical protein
MWLALLHRIRETRLCSNFDSGTELADGFSGFSQFLQPLVGPEGYIKLDHNRRIPYHSNSHAIHPTFDDKLLTASLRPNSSKCTP